MHLTELSFRRQAFVYFLLVCMIAGGILAYRSISKLEDPELVVMQSQIVTIWPGATAHEVMAGDTGYRGRPEYACQC